MNKAGRSGFSLGVLLMALALCWIPALTNSVLYFSDTASYLRGGDIIWGMAEKSLGLSGGPSVVADAESQATGAAPPVAERVKPYFVRSFLYSLASFGLLTLSGPLLVSFSQALATVIMLAAFLEPADRRRPAMIGVGALVLATLSGLPLYAAYLMPDIFAAVVILHAMLLPRRLGELGWGMKVTCTVISAFAVAAHYGNVPFALALIPLSLLVALVRRRLTVSVLLAGLFPLLFSPLANLTASSASLEETSPMPLRLPILLARSIEDGPARWYLRDACPEADLAFCELFADRIPDSGFAWLWDEGGIMSLSSEQMSRIRAEEFTILVGAIRAYPLQQIHSLSRNTLLQLVAVGTHDIAVATDVSPEYEFLNKGSPAAAKRLIRFYDTVLPWLTLILTAPLAILALAGRLSRRESEMLLVLIIGICLNATIFGGLSAPAERYQTRIVWLLTFLSLLVTLRRVGAGPGRSRPVNAGVGGIN